MKRIPWLIVGLLAGMWVGWIAGSPSQYHHGTFEETMREVYGAAIGGTVGLLTGILIDAAIGITRRRK